MNTSNEDTVFSLEAGNKVQSASLWRVTWGKKKDEHFEPELKALVKKNVPFPPSY